MGRRRTVPDGTVVLTSSLSEVRSSRQPVGTAQVVPSSTGTTQPGGDYRAARSELRSRFFERAD